MLTGILLSVSSISCNELKTQHFYENGTVYTIEGSQKSRIVKIFFKDDTLIIKTGGMGWHEYVLKDSVYKKINSFKLVDEYGLNISDYQRVGLNKYLAIDSNAGIALVIENETKKTFKYSSTLTHKHIVDYKGKLFTIPGLFIEKDITLIKSLDDKEKIIAKIESLGLDERFKIGDRFIPIKMNKLNHTIMDSMIYLFPFTSNRLTVINMNTLDTSFIPIRYKVPDDKKIEQFRNQQLSMGEIIDEYQVIMNVFRLNDENIAVISIYKNQLQMELYNILSGDYKIIYPENIKNIVFAKDDYFLTYVEDEDENSTNARIIKYSIY